MVRFLKIIAAVSAFVFMTQGCAVFVRDDDDFHHHHENWEHHEYGEHGH